MRIKLVSAVAVCLLLSGMRGEGAQPAQATGSAGGVGATVKVGTLGVGGELTLGLCDYAGIRLGANAFSYEPSTDTDEGKITGDLEWLSYGALLDIHPFGGGFRISGGGMLNKNKFKLRADLTKPVELNDREYSLSELHGQVTFEDFAPYLGIGYGNAVGADGRWHFSCDFGVMFQGEPKVDATAKSSNPALQPAVDAALAQEVEDIKDDAKNFQYYPVISVGVSFRF